MDTFYLDIKYGVRIQFDPLGLLDVVAQADLVFMLDLTHPFQNLRIVFEVFEGLQFIDVALPVRSQCVVQKMGKSGIGLDQEPAMADAVGLVVEPLRKDLIEFPENVVFQDLGMKGSHAIGGMRSDDAQVGHPYLVVPQDTDLPQVFRIGNTAFGKFFPEPSVDLFHDHVHTGKKTLEQFDIPFLQGFRKNGMIGEGDGILGDLPCIVPFQMLFIQEDPHQFRDAQSRMGIVDMNTDPFGEFGKFLPPVGFKILFEDVMESCSNHQVFLAQTEFLARAVGIIRIQDAGHGGDVAGFLHSCRIIPPVESSHIDGFMFGTGIKQVQNADVLAVFTDDRDVIRNSADALVTLMFKSHFAVFVLSVYIAAETDRNGIFRITGFPGIAVFQPWIRQFHLTAVHDLLTEQTEFITKADAFACDPQGCHRIQEAGSQTAETAVAEARFRFQIAHFLQVDAQFFQGGDSLIMDPDGIQIIIQELSDQELHGEIKHFFMLVLENVLFGLDPLVGSGMSDHTHECGVLFVVGACFQRFSEM